MKRMIKRYDKIWDTVEFFETLAADDISALAECKRLNEAFGDQFQYTLYKKG